MLVKFLHDLPNTFFPYADSVLSQYDPYLFRPETLLAVIKNPLYL